MAGKPTISASNALKDIRAGLSDAQIMEKYSLSSRGLQSLLSKLIQMNLITQADLDNRNNNAKSSQGQISARQIVADIKSGMSDLELMIKYDLSPQRRNSVFAKLIKSGYITRADLDRRQAPNKCEGTVDLSIESASALDSSKIAQGRPAQLTTKWFACPACGFPQNYEFKVCPQCGIVISKYKANLARASESIVTASGTIDTIGLEISSDDRSVPIVPRRSDTVDLPHSLSRPAESPRHDQDNAVFERLTKLRQLLEADILSDEEYRSKRAQLLRQAPHTQALLNAFDDGIITDEELEGKLTESLSRSGPPIAHQSPTEEASGRGERKAALYSARQSSDNQGGDARDRPNSLDSNQASTNNKREGTVTETPEKPPTHEEKVVASCLFAALMTGIALAQLITRSWFWFIVWILIFVIATFLGYYAFLDNYKNKVKYVVIAGTVFLLAIIGSMIGSKPALTTFDEALAAYNPEDGIPYLANPSSRPGGSTLLLFTGEAVALIKDDILLLDDTSEGDGQSRHWAVKTTKAASYKPKEGERIGVIGRIVDVLEAESENGTTVSVLLVDPVVMANAPDRLITLSR